MDTNSTTPVYGTIGSISHGTLRDQDLLESFGNALHDLAQQNYNTNDEDVAETAINLSDAIANGLEEYMDADAVSSLVNETLMHALDSYSPAYCYFGPHYGDASDFGFWPSIDSIQSDIDDGRLISVSDPAEVSPTDDPDIDGFVYVNDHGNMTVYSKDGKVILELV